jgi:hypothetical protein
MVSFATVLATTITLAVSMPMAGPSSAMPDQPPIQGDDIWAHLDDRSDEAALQGQNRTTDSGNDSSGSIVLEVAWTPTCDLNSPDGADDLCPAALSCPPTPQGRPQLRMWQWVRQWDRREARPLTPWSTAATRCVAGDASVENVHALALREFQDRVRLMKAPLHIQPPNGRTLVNFDTIFWTADPTRTFVDIPILGHRVDLRILPTRYIWRFGDGLQSQTATPGGPYPNKDVTHRYAGIGGVHPSLAVTYRGQYRVDGGPWIDMVGTATVDGPEVELTVVETRAQLVGG